jgi:hypothetical protein
MFLNPRVLQVAGGAEKLPLVTMTVKPNVVDAPAVTNSSR